MQVSLDDEKTSGLRTEAEAIQKEIADISVRIGQATEVNKQFDDLEKQRETLSDLKSKEAEIVQKEQEIIDTEETVKDFKVPRKELKTLRDTKDSKQREIDSKNRMKAETEGLLLDATNKQEEAHKRDTEVNAMGDTIAVLTPKRDAFDEIKRMEKELQTLKADMDAKASASVTAQNEWDVFVKDRAEKREFQQRHENVGEDLGRKQTQAEKFRKEKTDLQTIEKKCKDYVANEKRNSELRGRFKEASDSSTQAKESYNRMQEQFFASTVGRLASGLEEGKPCPVCGSLHHDNPAPPHEGAPTEGELKAYEKELQDKEKASSAAEKSLTESTAKLMSQMEEIRERAEALGMEYSTVPQLQSKVKDRISEIDDTLPGLDSEIEEMAETFRKLGEVRMYLAECDPTETKLNSEREKATREEQEAVQKHTTQEALIAEKKKDLGFDSLEALNKEIARVTNPLPHGPRRGLRRRQALQYAERHHSRTERFHIRHDRGPGENRWRPEGQG